MELWRPSPLRLLGSGVAPAADQNQAETSLLLYSERNGITAAEGVIGANKLLNNNYSLSFRFTYDGLTGATPNGAAPSRKLQTFTGPSGRAGYTIQSGQLPLDRSFHDTRLAADATIVHPLGRLASLSVGGHGSTERDYTSFGLNSGITRDFFQRNTTVGISGSFSYDVVSPIGGPVAPFSALSTASSGGQGGGEGEGEGEGQRAPRIGESKRVFDVLFGISQVLDRKTILRMNYSFDRSNGYLTDPYKLLSVVEDPSSPNAGDPIDYLHEKRPYTRNKNAVFGQIRRFISGSALDVSYRYFWDDWGVKSHTVETYFLWQLKNGHAIQPHIRWYRQSQASLYRPYLIVGNQLPQYASSDSRLAAFDALTLGLQYILPIDAASHLNISAEYYSQYGDRSPPQTFGSMAGLDLFPKLTALMFRVGYARNF